MERDPNDDPVAVAYELLAAAHGDRDLSLTIPTVFETPGMVSGSEGRASVSSEQAALAQAGHGVTGRARAVTTKGDTMHDYRNVQAVVRSSSGSASLQRTVRDALVAAGFEVVWSSTSGACDACQGRGYHDAGPAYQGATCLRQSKTCAACGGSGRFAPSDAVVS